MACLGVVRNKSLKVRLARLRLISSAVAVLVLHFVSNEDWWAVRDLNVPEAHKP